MTDLLPPDSIPLDPTPVSFEAGMYYAYGKQGREGLRAKNCFEAILNGERTSTTRFESDSPSQYRKWVALQPGDRVRVWSGKWDKERNAFGGRSAVVVITHAPVRLRLENISAAGALRWEATEGWNHKEIQAIIQRGYAEGLYIRYRLMGSTKNPPAKAGSSEPVSRVNGRRAECPPASPASRP